MAGIYCADIYCDDCIEAIKERIAREIWDEGPSAVLPDGTTLKDLTDCDNCDDSPQLFYSSDLHQYLDDMDEHAYDSDEYPKYCGDDEESDSPQHCGSGADCLNYEEDSDGDRYGHFFGNNLTSDGEHYVEEAVNDDLMAGYMDSPAVQLWMPCYDYLEYVEQCANCGSYGNLNNDDECDDCADIPEYTGTKSWTTGKCGCSGFVPHATYRDAANWIEEKRKTDPSGVAAGNYYIDCPKDSDFVHEILSDGAIDWIEEKKKSGEWGSEGAV